MKRLDNQCCLQILGAMSYVGMAKRIASSFFPQAVPVPQLQPLDARKIFYASDEDAWAAFLTWEDAKVQEREAKTVKAATRMKYDIYDPSTWPPYVWPAQPASVRCKKPYDAHLASLLAAPVAPLPKPPSMPMFGTPAPAPSPYAAAVDDFGDFHFWDAAQAAAAPSPPAVSQPSPTKKPSLFGDDSDSDDLFGDDESGCPYPDSDKDEGDGDYGTDDDSLCSWDAF